MQFIRQFFLFTLALSFYSCSSNGQKNGVADKPQTVATPASGTVELPQPFATKSATHFSHVVGWEEGRTPTAPTGFTVTRFADGLENPRWIYVGPNGDIFIAESGTPTRGLSKVKNAVSGKSKSENGGSANRITLIRDTDGDGKPDLRTTFLEGLNQPFGMLIIGNSFYVGNTDGVVQFPYSPGQTSITAAGKKIVGTACRGLQQPLDTQPDGI